MDKKATQDCDMVVSPSHDLSVTLKGLIPPCASTFSGYSCSDAWSYYINFNVPATAAHPSAEVLQLDACCLCIVLDEFGAGISRDIPR